MEDIVKQNKGELVALAYFDLIGKPLNIRELRRYGWVADIDFVDLKKIAKDYLWEIDGAEYFSLKQYSVGEIRENVDRLDKYWRWVKSRLWALRMVPFVEGIMLMNGMAHGVVNPSSDIDLFVITSPRRTWLVRGWMLVWLTVLGMRATARQKAMRFSPEFFVSSAMMNMREVASPSRVMTAFWLADFTPIVYTEKFVSFWRSNYWLSGVLPVAYRSPKKGLVENDVKPMAIKGLERILRGRLGDSLEKWMMDKQVRIIRKNLNRLGKSPDYILEPEMIKIHFDSRRPQQVEDAIERFVESDS